MVFFVYLQIPATPEFTKGHICGSVLGHECGGQKWHMRPCGPHVPEPRETNFWLDFPLGTGKSPAKS